MPFAINLVNPPCEVEQQFVKTLLQKIAIRTAGLQPIHIVNAPYRPGMNRGIQVAKLPFIGGDLTIGMLKLFKQ